MVNSGREHPEEIALLRKQYFSSSDGLLTLAMAGRGPEMTTSEVWQSDLRLARELGIRSTIHMGAAGRGPRYHAIEQMNQAGTLGEDLTFDNEQRRRTEDDVGATPTASPCHSGSRSNRLRPLTVICRSIECCRPVCGQA